MNGISPHRMMSASIISFLQHINEILCIKYKWAKGGPKYFFYHKTCNNVSWLQETAINTEPESLDCRMIVE